MNTHCYNVQLLLLVISFAISLGFWSSIQYSVFCILYSVFSVQYSVFSIQSMPGSLYKPHADSIENTSRQGSISRVQQSVASETLLIDNGNVFRLIRCYSTEIICYDLSLWDFYNFYCSCCAEMTVR
jgi:hypothetical protein